MEMEKLKSSLEALFAACDKPLSVNQIYDLFNGGKQRFEDRFQLFDFHSDQALALT